MKERAIDSLVRFLTAFDTPRTGYRTDTRDGAATFRRLGQTPMRRCIHEKAETVSRPTRGGHSFQAQPGVIHPTFRSLLTRVCRISRTLVPTTPTPVHAVARSRQCPAPVAHLAVEIPR